MAVACVVTSSGCTGKNRKIEVPRLFDIKTLESIGHHIYEQDRYASIATELLFRTAGDPSSLTREGLMGWVFTEEKGGKVVIRFVKENGAVPRPAYDIIFANFREARCQKADAAQLSTADLAQYRAKKLVSQNLSRREWPLYNFIAMPDVERKGFLVYAIASTYDPNLAIAGGHYRFTVSSDGRKIELIEKLFKSPLVLDKRSVPEGSGNCLFATHNSSDTPAETHVYLSLKHSQPFYIATCNGDLWRVEKGRLERTGHLEVTANGIHARTGMASSSAAGKHTGYGD